MAENILYILGAGFSAPLGLPLMGNFISMSKDLYSQAPDRFATFEPVFDELDRMAKIKNFFSSDQTNIEEVLSILEMNSRLFNENSYRAFASYVSAVIKGYTPVIKPEVNSCSNWYDFLFSSDLRWLPYGNFAAQLFGLSIVPDKIQDTYNFTKRVDTPNYNVITLNYDVILESTINHLACQFGLPSTFSFWRPSDNNKKKTSNQVSLCKLHGSVDTENIVCPTWNKSLKPEILREWQEAHRLIGQANHIRIIGYSLPESDAYFKYLMKAGILKSKHLKTVDVLCLDDGAVKERYSRFLDPNYFRFKNEKTEDYLKLCSPRINIRNPEYNSLEMNHEAYYKK